MDSDAYPFIGLLCLELSLLPIVGYLYGQVAMEVVANLLPILNLLGALIFLSLAEANRI